MGDLPFSPDGQLLGFQDQHFKRFQLENVRQVDVTRSAFSRKTTICRLDEILKKKSD
jgi:hypothetical protein